MDRHIFTKAEELVINNLFGKIPIEEIARKLNLSTEQIRKKAYKLGKTIFTRNQLNFIKDNLDKPVEFFTSNPIFINIDKFKIKNIIIYYKSEEWTDSEIQILEELASNKNLSLKEIKECLPNRTYEAIRNKLSRLNNQTLRRYRIWEDQEIQFILENYGKMKTKDIASTLNCTETSIRTIYSRKNK